MDSLKDWIQVIIGLGAAIIIYTFMALLSTSWAWLPVLIYFYFTS